MYVLLHLYKGKKNVFVAPPRVHELEEQVKDAETKADQVLEDEAKRHREAYHKIERDRNLEIDLLCNRYSLQHNAEGRGLNLCQIIFLNITNLHSVERLDKMKLFTQTAAARRREWKNEDKRVQAQVSD